MELLQWLGIALVLASLVLFLTLVIKMARSKNPQSPLPLLGCMFCVVLGAFLAAIRSRATTTLVPLASWQLPADAITFWPGHGLVRAVYKKSATDNDRNVDLFLDQNDSPVASIPVSGVSSLATHQDMIYIGDLLLPTIWAWNTSLTQINTTYPLQSFVVAQGIIIANLLTPDGGRIFIDNVPIPNQTSILRNPSALALDHDMVYISDTNRVLVWSIKEFRFIRDIGPLPAARRMVVWKDHLVIVPIHPLSLVQLFTLHGDFVANAANSEDCAASLDRLFLSDRGGIRVFSL